MEKILEKVPSWILALSILGLFILISISIYLDKPFKIASWEFGAATVVQPTDVTNEKIPVGTVIASVLNPTNFSHYYGEEWVIADGRELNTRSGYFKITGKAKVPDLRGRFIRGMDLGANVDSEKGRVVGSYQKDSTKLPNKAFKLENTDDHYHLQGYDATAISGKFGVADAGKHAGRYEHSPDASAAGNKSSKTSNSGGHTHLISGGDLETNPKNIALFYYIKID